MPLTTKHRQWISLLSKCSLASQMLETKGFKGGGGGENTKRVLAENGDPQFDAIWAEWNRMVGSQWFLKISFWWQLQGELMVRTLSRSLWWPWATDFSTLAFGYGCVKCEGWRKWLSAHCQHRGRNASALHRVGSWTSTLVSLLQHSQILQQERVLMAKTGDKSQDG